MRGLVSGILQAGYPTGYLLASLVYALVFPLIGWRGMFMIGVVPAPLVLYIRKTVLESPVWRRKPARDAGTLAVSRAHWRLGLYAVAGRLCGPPASPRHGSRRARTPE